MPLHQRRRFPNAKDRTLAVGECACLVVFVWVAYKALKTVADDPWNVAPGAMMLLAAAVLGALRGRHDLRRAFAAADWRRGLATGIALSVCCLAVGGLEIVLLSTGRATPADLPTSTALRIAAIRIPAYLASVAWIVTSERFNRPGHAATAFCLALLAALLCIAPIVAICAGADVSDVVSFSISSAVVAPLGEELFFRGYLQSRLNDAFPRPWRCFGVRFGPGLLIAAALFGGLHVFNPTRPFDAQWQTSWLWGATAALAGIVFGLLREKTAGVYAGAVVHSLTGLYRGIWQTFLP